jgi:hypothetical protein
MTQFQFVKQEINVLLDSGEISKKLIYNRLEETTRLPRTTIRRCVRDFKIELTTKVKILSTKDYKRNPSMQYSHYFFIPEHIRYHFKLLLKKNFVKVNCIICNTALGYLEKESIEPIICSDCRNRFPESKNHFQLEKELRDYCK